MKLTYFESSKNDNSPIVCNVPHAGTFVPEVFKGNFVLSEENLEKEVKYMADNYTGELYGELLYVSSYIQSNISRIVVDIERFQDEQDEPMSGVGMSALYTLTSSGDALRELVPESRTNLQKIYRDYHQALTGLVDSTLIKNSKVIIVDCHSFPSRPRVYESDQASDRPDICIGTDEDHTPPALVDILKKNFESLGFSVKLNSPFAGSIVPMRYYHKDKRVVSVMIEVNRKLYMNEETFEKLPHFSKTSKSISRRIITSLNQFV